MAARVNGETWAEGGLGSMLYTFPEVIAHLSQEQPLLPGDVLGSGTVGRGCGLELDRWIEPGDVVELEVQGIGVLRNTVGQRPAVIPEESIIAEEHARMTKVILQVYPALGAEDKMEAMRPIGRNNDAYQDMLDGPDRGVARRPTTSATGGSPTSSTTRTRRGWRSPRRRSC